MALAGLLSLLLWGGLTGLGTPSEPVRTPPNLIVVVADDVGTDRIGAYAENPTPGNTPHIDRLAAEGVLFRNAWATPYCSPSRAALLTGRHGFRTGVGKPILPGLFPPQTGMSDQEITLADSLTQVGYRSYVLGKWHLAAPTDSPLHPMDCGFELHAGSLFNLGGTGGLSSGDYEQWSKWVQGVPHTSTTYATTDTTDDAILALETLEEPWFLYLPYNAAHKPFHVPPADLHGFELEGDPKDTPVPHFKAAVEALDAELGRLLDALDASPAGRRTHVVFLGDNGTPKDAIDAPQNPDHGKGSLYEGAVRVPFIVRGPSVRKPGREELGLVGITDVFATALEWADVPLPESAEDSVSFAPLLELDGKKPTRGHLYTEKFSPNGPPPWDSHGRAVRNQDFKLLRFQPSGNERLFDLRNDPFEEVDLLEGELTSEAAQAYAELSKVLVAISG